MIYLCNVQYTCTILCDNKELFKQYNKWTLQSLIAIIINKLFLYKDYSLYKCLKHVYNMMILRRERVREYEINIMKLIQVAS